MQHKKCPPLLCWHLKAQGRQCIASADLLSNISRNTSTHCKTSRSDTNTQHPRHGSVCSGCNWLDCRKLCGQSCSNLEKYEVCENNLILIFIFGVSSHLNDPLNILVFPLVRNLCLLRLSSSSMLVEPHGRKARNRTLDYLLLQVAFKVIYYPPFSNSGPPMLLRPALAGYRRLVGVIAAPNLMHLLAETIGSAYWVSCSAFLTRELDPLKP